MAWTWISGGTMSGYCEMGRFNIDTMPMTTVRMAMTMATIGRRMKKFESIVRYLAVAGVVSGEGGGGAGCGDTGAPSLSFCRLLTMTRAPGWRPELITQS